MAGGSGASSGGGGSSAAVLLSLNFVAAISCIMVNRRLMKPPLSFQMPIFITLIGYSSSVVGLVVCRQLGMLPRHNAANPSFTSDGWGGDSGTGKRGLGRGGARSRRLYYLIATTALAPVMANYSLLFNSVGVYQLSKVLVTPSIIFFDRLRGAAPLSAERIMCLLVVSLGVTIVTVGDVSVNVPGLAVATCNIAIAGYYKVEWAHTCRTRKLSSLELMTLVMPKATLMLAALALCIEGRKLFAYEWADALEHHGILGLLGMCGVTAFFTSWTGYVVISNLSALTHQLLGQAKTCIILLAGYLLFSSPLSATQGYGALLAMAAMVAYTKFTMDDPASGKRRRPRGSKGGGGAILPLHSSAASPSSSSSATSPSSSSSYPSHRSQEQEQPPPPQLRRPPNWPHNTARVKRRGGGADPFVI
jgi:hypothetical protein